MQTFIKEHKSVLNGERLKSLYMKFLYWNNLKIIFSQKCLYCLQNVNSTERNSKSTINDTLVIILLSFCASSTYIKFLF